MPNLSQFVASPDLYPMQSGEGRGIVQIPDVPLPGASPGAGQAVGAGLAQLGEGTAVLGAGLQRAQLLESAQQKAQDTLDAKTGLQDWLQKMQPEYDSLKDGDYRTLPDETMRRGKALMEETSRSMTPQARALFAESANRALSVLQQDALGERRKRRNENTAYTLERTVQGHLDTMARTTNPVDRMSAQVELEDTLQRFVETGLIRGVVAADLLKKTTDTVQVQDVQIAIQAYPEAMKTQLQAQTRGEPTNPNLPLAPPENLAQLTQQAVTVSRERFNDELHQEQQADRVRKKQQEQNSVDLRTRIYTTPPTPDNVPVFQQIIQQAAAATQAGALDPTTGEHIMQTAQAHAIAAAKPPPQVDNPDVERTIRLAVHTAEAPQQFDQAREALTTATQQGQLKSETYSALADKLESREKASYWRNRPQVMAGKDVLMRGGLIPYGGQLAGYMKPEVQMKLANALDSYETQLEVLLNDPKGGPKAVDAQAVGLAWDIRRAMLRPSPDELKQYLPDEMQRATTVSELQDVVRRLRKTGQWTDPQLKIAVDNWYGWRANADLQEQQKQQQAPATPGSSANPLPYTGPTLPPMRTNSQPQSK